MEPLNQYEIQELLAAMGDAHSGIPTGSVWTKPDVSQMFIVLHHANMPMGDSAAPMLVLQALPSGQAWVQPTDMFRQDGWINVGFVWDRGVME